MKRTKKALYSIALAVCIVMGPMPLTALTAHAATSYDISEGNVTISGSGTYTITGTSSTHTVTVSGGSPHVTLSGADIEPSGCAFRLEGSASVHLTLNGENTLKSGSYYAGIRVPEDSEITIDGTGSLTVTGGNAGGSGIGGNGGDNGVDGTRGENAGTVNISGGTVTTKGTGGAGIGGGNNGGNGGEVNISGGNVNAKAYSGGRGIGGGYCGISYKSDSKGSTVTISGGTVKVDAITGYGAKGDCYISGGSVDVNILSPYKSNSKSTKVVRTDVKLDGAKSKQVTDLTVQTSAGKTYDYGITDIYTNYSGTIYIWLPSEAKVTGAKTKTATYATGSVEAGRSGTLYSAVSTTTTVSISNKDASKSTNTYGDTLKIKALVKDDDGAVKPDKSEVEFFCGGTSLGEATAVDSSGYATLEYDTTEKIIPCGSEQSIKAVYTPSSADSSKYKESTANAVSVTIKKKALTASVKPGQSKTYDGKTNMENVTLSLTGIESPGSTADKVTASADITLEDKNVGESRAVKGVTSVSLSGGDKGYYTLNAGDVAKTASVQITKKDITLSLPSDDKLTKVFDGTNTASLQLKSDGFVSGEVDTVKATVTLDADTPNASDGGYDFALSDQVYLDSEGKAAADSVLSNYTVSELPDTAGKKFKITQADAPIITPPDEVSLEAKQEMAIDIKDIVSKLKEKGYSLADGGITVKDDNSILASSKAAMTDDGKVTFKGADVFTVGSTATITLKFTSSNYADETVTLTAKAVKTDISSKITDGFKVESKSYNGETVSAALPSFASGTYTASENGDAELRYYAADASGGKTGSALACAPVNAGTYIAEYKIPDDNAIYQGICDIKFTIDKAIITPALTVTGLNSGTKLPDYASKITYGCNTEIGSKEANDFITAGSFVTVTDKDGNIIEAGSELTAGVYTVIVSMPAVTDGANFTSESVVYILNVRQHSSYTQSSAKKLITATSATADQAAKAALEKIVGADSNSVMATVGASTKAVMIKATSLKGQNVYMYTLENGTLTLADSKQLTVGYGGTVTLSDPITQKTTVVLIPASEKPPVSNVTGIVEVEQGATFGFNLNSGEFNNAGFTSGSNKVAVPRYGAYKDGKTGYGTYGHGKLNQITGIYINGVKLFDVKIVKAPYRSDTTVDISSKKHGATYWFKITPDNAKTVIGYTAGNGAVLSTRSKGKQKDGSYLLGVKIIGKPGDKSGVYINIGGKIYCVFNIAVA